MATCLWKIWNLMFAKVVTAPANQIALKFFKVSRLAYIVHYAAILHCWIQCIHMYRKFFNERLKPEVRFLNQLSACWHPGSNADVGESSWEESGVFSIPAHHPFEHWEGVILYLPSGLFLQHVPLWPLTPADLWTACYQWPLKHGHLELNPFLEEVWMTAFNRTLTPFWIPHCCWNTSFFPPGSVEISLTYIIV